MMPTITATAEFAAACRSFLDHWISLRDGAVVPSLDVWLTHLPASIATRKFRAELLPNDAFVLFNGSANILRRGRNNTGDSLFRNDDPDRQEKITELRHVVSKPCGLWTETLYAGPDDLFLRTQTIILPLNLPTGRWPQVVGFVCELDQPPPNVVFRGAPQRIHFEWIDIGCGTPRTTCA